MKQIRNFLATFLSLCLLLGGLGAPALAAPGDPEVWYGGYVFDQGGAPIGGVTITVKDAYGQPLTTMVADGIYEELKITPEGDGYWFVWLPKGTQFTFTAKASGYASQEITVLCPLEFGEDLYLCPDMRLTSTQSAPADGGLLLPPNSGSDSAQTPQQPAATQAPSAGQSSSGMTLLPGPAAQALTAPVLHAIAGETVTSADYAVSWDAVAGASHYLFSLTDATAIEYFVQNERVDGTSYMLPTGRLTSGQVYWAQVSAVDASGKATDPSYLRFTYAPPSSVVAQQTPAADSSVVVPKADGILLPDAGTATNAEAPDASAADTLLPSEGETGGGLTIQAYQAPSLQVPTPVAALKDASAPVEIEWFYSGSATPEYFEVTLTTADGAEQTQKVETGNSVQFGHVEGEMTAKVAAWQKGSVLVEREVTFTVTTAVPDTAEASALLASGDALPGEMGSSQYESSIAMPASLAMRVKAAADAVLYAKSTTSDVFTATTGTIAAGTAVTATQYYQADDNTSLTFFAVTYASGASQGYVLTSALEPVDTTRIGAPTNLLNTTLDSVYPVITWANGDTKGRTPLYRARIYQTGTTAPAYGFVFKDPTFTVTTPLSYGVDYTFDVIAVLPGVDATVGQSTASSLTIRLPVYTNALTTPVLTGDITSGKLIKGLTGMAWGTVANATGYEWRIYDATGAVIATETTATTSVLATNARLSLLTVGQTYTFALRATTTNTLYTTSQWITKAFDVMDTTTAFITSLSIAAGSQIPLNTATAITLHGNVPATAVLHITDKATGAVTRESKTINTTTKQTTHTFTTAGTYELYFENATGYPNSATLEVNVGTLSVTIADKANFVTKPINLAFQVSWNWIDGVTYTLELKYLDGTAFNPITVAKADLPVTIPAGVLTKIGPCQLIVKGVQGTTVIQDAVEFEVINNSFTAWTGKAKKDSTAVYKIPSNTAYMQIGSLAKDTEVRVIGESGNYYHVTPSTYYTGYSFTSITQQLTTTSATAFGFIAKDDLSGAPSSGGSSSGGSSSGGSSSGGASGSRPSTGTTGTGSISTTAYKETFGSTTVRKESYSYIPDLFAPLMQKIEEGEITPKSELDLLATSFAPLPSELNSEQYAAVRERAAWNMVSSYLTMMVTDDATELVGASDGLQQAATGVSTTIGEVLAQQQQGRQMDESIVGVLTMVQQNAQKLIGDTQTTGQLQGTTPQQVALDATTKILDTDPQAPVEEKPFDPELMQAVQTSLQDPAAQPNEPMEVRMLRTLYAMADYEQTKLSTVLDGLPDSARVTDINTVQDAYLDYVFAVAKLHQLAYAFGGAAADTVVENWGAEISRLIAVNRVFNTYAQ